jgi:hypothetical protein
MGLDGECGYDLMNAHCTYFYLLIIVSNSILPAYVVEFYFEDL